MTVAADKVTTFRAFHVPGHPLLMPNPWDAGTAKLAQAGVARISVGRAFSQVALAALTRAGRELLDHGTYGFLDLAAEGRRRAVAAFRVR